MKLFLSIFFLFTIASFPAVIEETESLEAFLYGHAPGCEYNNWMSHIVEGIASAGYNLYAPWDRQTNGFGNYQIPSANDLQNWEQITNSFLNGYLTTAQNLIDDFEYPYQVVIFHDTDSDRVFHLLREIPDFDYYDDNGTTDPDDDEHGAFDYGWGLYIHYPQSPYPHITTAPHPNDDFVSIPLAHKVFIDHESRFLMIAGAGREVVWTNIGSYNNSKSISDPTRREEHVYNVFYQKACDFIRNLHQHHEFSLQVHSFDWGDRHFGFPDVQISGGFYVSSPDLPIRDFSEDKLDMVNISPVFIHPANKVGLHDPVHLNDFYGFHSTEYDFYYSSPDTTFAVNTSTDLWGYSQNRQIVYTNFGMNNYDNFERFFHVEVDELPNAYPQTIANYHWFHGWNPVSGTWNMDERFDKTLLYYAPFIDALTEILPYVYQMNDNAVPAAPTDLQAISQCADHITISWQPGDAYDIQTYEILYSQLPLSAGNYQIIDSSNFSKLSCLAQKSFTLSNLQEDEVYFFAVRLKDKNGNVSELSNEIFAITGPVSVNSFIAFGGNDRVFLEWNSSSNTDFSGFNLFRKTAGSDFELIDSWAANSDLLGQTGLEIPYQYDDTDIESGVIYTYKLSFEADDLEYDYGLQRSAESRPVLKLIASINSPAISDTCYFGSNYFASNGYDELFDLPANTNATGEYLLTEFYEQYWNNVPNQLEQEIYSLYDPASTWKSWTYRLRTNLLNQSIEISLDTSRRNAERIYLYRNGIFVDLTTENFIFTATSSNDYYSFTLYYGNLKPTLEFVDLPNQLFFPGETVTIGWEVNLHSLIDNINIFAANDEISIPITSELPPSETSFEWQVANLLQEDLSFRLDLIMAEGDTLSYFSPYKFGIISPQLIVQTAAGWNLKTNHLQSSQYSWEYIYGNNVEFFELQEEFINVYQPEFLHPYWIYAPQNHYASLSSVTLQKTPIGFALNAGWNIIPNPHRASYRLDQLVFSVNNQDFEYYQAIQNGLIEPAIFDFECGFIKSGHLTSASAYYLYCYQPGLEIKYIPYYQNQYSPKFDLDWKIELTASQDGKNSQVVCGRSELADSLFNPTLDILKPEILPFADRINLYLPFNAGSQTPLHLYQSVSDYQNNGDEILLSWTAEIELLSLDPVLFSIEQFDLPADLLLYLEMPDLLLDFSETAFQEYSPLDSIFTFTILVSSEPFISTDEELISAKITAFNYPNPFNPATTISFNLLSQNPEYVKLVIYNVKGQKVKQLIEDRLAPGLHSVVWNGKDENGKQSASGVYFYRLKSGDNPPLIRKMLLLK